MARKSTQRTAKPQPRRNIINYRIRLSPWIFVFFLVLAVVIAYFLGRRSVPPGPIVHVDPPFTNEQITPSVEPTDVVVAPIEDVTQAPIRVITQHTDPNWGLFDSNTGYVIQSPPGFISTKGEYRDGDACVVLFNNNAGGIFSSTLVPYNGGSRRALLKMSSGYTYTFEDVMIQGRKSLLVEAGPIGDSGSGSNVVIPVGNTALVISFSNRAKDSAAFTTMLEGIKIPDTLYPDRCPQ